MELLRELTSQHSNTEYLPLTEALEEAVKKLPGSSRGGKTSVKGASDFFKANPGLTIAAGAMAVDAYSKYKKNKRNTINLHARDAYEKKMMTDVVDALTRSGKFKIRRTKFEHGGKTWVLKRA